MRSKTVFAATLFLLQCQADAPKVICQTDIGEQVFCNFSKLGNAQINACSALFFEENTATALLDGEAFFECQIHQILKVKIPEGRLVLRSAKVVVRVRPELFEIKIFEGEAVFEPQNGSKIQLKKGEAIRRDSTETGFKKVVFNQKSFQPDWLTGKTSFENERLRNVFFELERQYDIRIKLPADLAVLLFSGSFEHQNLEKALHQICRPTQLFWEKTGQKILVRNVK